MTRTPALRRFASRTTTAPGTGSRLAADPRIVTWNTSSIGGWWCAKRAIKRNSSALSAVMSGTSTSPAMRMSSQRMGLWIGGSARMASTVNAMNATTATTSSHGLCGPVAGRHDAADQRAILAGLVAGVGIGVAARRARPGIGASGHQSRLRQGPAPGDKNASDEVRRVSRPVVLVHGAWHGAWCWERVVPLLDAAGVATVAVDLPSVSSPTATLRDDAECVRAAIDAIGGDAVLAGHSYGGAVISEAGVHPNVVHLVYLTAFALEAGESAQDNTLTGGDEPSDLGPAIGFGEGVFTIKPEPGIAAFFHDCAPEVARSAAARLRPQSRAALGGAVEAAAWREKDATYVVCTDDRALPVALQRSNAARIGSSVDWPTSHSPFLSRPDLVAGLLAEISSR